MPPRKATSAPVAAVGDPLEVVLEVADEAADVEARVLVDQRLGGLVGDLLGDVDRDVGVEAAGVAHRARAGGGSSRPSRSRARPGSRGAPAAATISAERVGEDRALGPGRVVLGQLGDLLEELRAALVVEVLRRQLLRRRREAGADVARPSSRAVVGVEVDLDRSLGGGPSHRQRPSRSGCRRRSGGARAGPSCGSSARIDVAARSPRSRRAAPCSSSPKKTSEYSR